MPGQSASWAEHDVAILVNRVRTRPAACLARVKSVSCEENQNGVLVLKKSKRRMTILTGVELMLFQSAAARFNFFAMDRLDLLYSAEELMQKKRPQRTHKISFTSKELPVTQWNIHYWFAYVCGPHRTVTLKSVATPTLLDVLNDGSFGREVANPNWQQLSGQQLKVLDYSQCSATLTFAVT